MKKEKSFTLIEILVVIAIIGILASVIVVATKGARDKAKKTVVLQFASQVYHALGADAVGMWDFDEGTGDTAKDRSGYKNNGSLGVGAGCPPSTPIPDYCPTWQCGKDDTPSGQGCSLSFNGSDEYVFLNKEVVMDLEHATISWFMKREEEDYETIFSKTTAASSSLIEIDKYTNQFYLEPTVNNGFNLYLDTKINTHDGQFHHYAITFRRTDNDNNLTLYVDGTKKDNLISTDGTFDDSLTIKYIGYQGLQVTYIYGDWFRGTIDEVRIYSEALTSAQIKKIYVEGLERHKLAEK